MQEESKQLREPNQSESSKRNESIPCGGNRSNTIAANWENWVEKKRESLLPTHRIVCDNDKCWYANVEDLVYIQLFILANRQESGVPSGANTIRVLLLS
jgi:hypothetical protein